jgi:2-polyprenyl-6-methoxyphenol hydroxylase-like FAD-dependent oxidoreductase
VIGLNIKYNKRFTKYEEHSDHVEIFFEDGTSARADLLIGADGAQSLVRKHRCPEIVNENLNLINVGGTIAVDAVKVDHIAKYASKGLLRVLGENGRSLLTFEFKPANDKTSTFLWSISWPHPAGHEMKDIFGCDLQTSDRATFTKIVHEKIIQEAEKNFSNSDVVTIIRSTPIEELIDPRHVYSSKPRKIRPWSKTTRVLLLGDAVHPMTTHAGLGKSIYICFLVTYLIALYS